MKLTNHTLFPLTLILIGILILIGNGDEPLSNQALIQLGALQKPVGLVIIALGAWLYYRSRNR